VTDTSAQAAESVGREVKLSPGSPEDDFAGTVAAEVLDYLRLNPAGATADEIAYALKQTAFTVRPRCTELREAGLIKDSGRRGKNTSGRNAIVWVLA
jgi:hypothetical protein